jgi:hypothetical protein
MKFKLSKLWLIRLSTVALLLGSSYIFSLKFFEAALETWEAAVITIPMSVLVYILFEAVGAVLTQVEKHKAVVVVFLAIGAIVYMSTDFSQGNFVINTGREKKLQAAETFQQASLDTSKAWLAYQTQNLSSRKKLEAKIASQNTEIEALRKKERSAKWRYSQGIDQEMAQIELSSVQSQLNNLTSSRSENEKAVLRLSDAYETEKSRRQALLEAKQANLRQAGVLFVGSDLIHSPTLAIIVVAFVMAVYAASLRASELSSIQITAQVPKQEFTPELRLEVPTVSSEPASQVFIETAKELTLVEAMVRVKLGYWQQKDVCQRFNKKAYEVSRLFSKAEKKAEALKLETGRNGIPTFRAAVEKVVTDMQVVEVATS